MRFPWIGLLSATVLTVTSLFSLFNADAVTRQAVVQHYVAPAEAMYADALSAALDSLLAQTHGIKSLVTAMNLSINVEGSDHLDKTSAVQWVSP
jgi:uncharacterized iron-regulated protein